MRFPAAAAAAITIAACALSARTGRADDLGPLILTVSRDLGAITTTQSPDAMEWMLLASAIGGTAALAPRDVSVYRRLHRDLPNPKRDGYSAGHCLSFLGRGEVQLDLLLGLAAVGGQRERKAALAAAEALAATGIVVSTPKLATARP